MAYLMSPCMRGLAAKSSSFALFTKSIQAIARTGSEAEQCSRDRRNSKLCQF